MDNFPSSFELELIDPVDAAHVLNFFNPAEGMVPGSFMAALISAVARADRNNRLLLATMYPGVVAAMNIAQNYTAGLGALRERARLL